MNNQVVITEYSCRGLGAVIPEAQINKKIFAVCDKALLKLERVKALIESAGCAAVFSDFSPNPDFESVLRGKALFERSSCNTILAIGGGSAVDVAKCIKYYAFSGADKPNCVMPPANKDIALIAVPATAGTGSEATRFAVVYYKGEKQSVESDDIIPEYVILDASVLETLPAYQRASTAFDALCHAVESFWSVNSTDESRAYAQKAIEMFFANYEGYLNNERSFNEGMLTCANLAGRAINISKTTAAHAMSYKITKLTGASHGHSAALCLPFVWQHIAENTGLCVDSRGADYLRDVMKKLNELFGCKTAAESVELLKTMLSERFRGSNPVISCDDIDALSVSVNAQRLANSPVPFGSAAIKEVYLGVKAFCERNGA